MFLRGRIPLVMLSTCFNVTQIRDVSNSLREQEYYLIVHGESVNSEPVVNGSLEATFPENGA